MKRILTLLRRTLPIWILAGGIAFLFYLKATKPVTERRPPPETLIEVEAVHLQPVDYELTLESQGSVRARTESTLIPEVTGRILWISPQFREGGFFSKGDVLVEIDPSDYKAAVTVAEADLANARLRLAEEAASSNQARLDWERLGIEESPSGLALREPQLALARANVAAAEAGLEKARRDLERTRIVAPYPGRILSKRADVGQVVGPNSVLAEIYAVDYAEIRLPLTMKQYAMLDLELLGKGNGENAPGIPVTLRTRFGPEPVFWEGHIVRVEGAVDTASRQIYVIAQVNDPYGTHHSRPLKVGLFVEAHIAGKSLEEVYVLPRTALREARFVLTLDGENRIHRVEVDPLWSTSALVVFREPTIQPGTPASLTQMALALDGMKVQPTFLDEGPMTNDKRPMTNDQ